MVKNFDVASALFKGEISSALDHYNQAGKAEGRIGAPSKPSTFNIEFDYRFDTNGFFADPARKATLDAAAKVWESVIQDEFPDIPAGTTFFVENPQTENVEMVVLDKEIDDLVIFVGVKPLGDASGVTNGYAIGYEDADRSSFVFPNRIEGNNYEPYAGSISFDTETSFESDPTPFIFNDDPVGNFDGSLFGTAIHEIGHALGIGASRLFENRTTGIVIEGANASAVFDGSNARTVNGGNPISLVGEVVDGQPFISHISPTFVSSKGVPALLGGGGGLGAYIPTEVDLAVLADIGYQIAGGF